MALAALLSGTAPAGAGDRALIDFLGYSGDGRYFAFEEFGIQDGSGFPYSNVYVVDLPADRWVPGTPFRRRAEDETAALADVRAGALAAAKATIEKLRIDAPAQIAALIGDGVPDNDGTALRFGPPGYEPGAVTGVHQLRLETFPATSPEPCADYLGEPARGFALTLEGEGSVHELHRDATLPGSRGCPTTYRIYGVVVRPETGTLDSAVAIVSVYPFGFEGPDRRFIAVPLSN